MDTDSILVIPGLCGLVGLPFMEAEWPDNLRVASICRLTRRCRGGREAPFSWLPAVVLTSPAERERPADHPHVPGLPGGDRGGTLLWIADRPLGNGADAG